MPRFGPWEIALILVIVLIIFGAGKLPQIGESLGKAIRSFRKAQTGEGGGEEKEKPNKKESPQDSSQSRTES